MTDKEEEKYQRIKKNIVNSLIKKRMTITIEIKRDTWKKLNILKEAGGSFDSVIRKLLDEIQN